jgi:hypothetical protein
MTTIHLTTIGKRKRGRVEVPVVVETGYQTQKRQFAHSGGGESRKNRLLRTT